MVWLGFAALHGSSFYSEAFPPIAIRRFSSSSAVLTPWSMRITVWPSRSSSQASRIAEGPIAKVVEFQSGIISGL